MLGKEHRVYVWVRSGAEVRRAVGRAYSKQKSLLGRLAWGVVGGIGDKGADLLPFFLPLVVGSIKMRGLWRRF